MLFFAFFCFFFLNKISFIEKHDNECIVGVDVLNGYWLLLV